MSTKHRTATIQALTRLGVSPSDTAQLLRDSALMRTWHEHECNGALQEDGEDSGKWYWHSPYDGKRLCRAANRYEPAKLRATRIAHCYGLTAYIQGDPRGCALYLLRKGDVPVGEDPESYYSRGIAVVPR